MLLKVNCFSLYKAYSLGKLFINFVVKVAKSLADVKCSSSGNPVELTKFVSDIPMAPAYEFIKSTKPSSVPPTYSAIATDASFPD